MNKLLTLCSTMTLKQLPTYASAAEALAGKNGIKITTGSELYSHFGNVAETEIEIASPQTIIVELDTPATLYAYDYVNCWHNDWWGQKPLSNMWGSNDNGVTWETVTFDYNQTSTYNSGIYIAYYLYMNQKVNNTSVYKKYKVFLDGSGDTAGFAKLNLYFRSF